MADVDAWPQSAGVMAVGVGLELLGRGGGGGGLQQITCFLFHVKMLSTSTETCFTTTGFAYEQAAGTSLGMGALKWERGTVLSPAFRSFSTTSGRESQ